MPDALIMDTRLSLQSRALYPLLRHLIWQQTGVSEDTMTAELGTLDTIAEAAGCSVTALKDYLAELRLAKWLSTARARRGRPYTYTLYSEPAEPESGPAQGRIPAHSRARGSSSPSNKVPDSTVGAEAPTVARARNLVFDAIAEATGENVAIAGSKIAKAEKAIRAAEADSISEQVQLALAAQPELDEIPKQRIDAWLAEKVKRRARRYRECRPEWELTATALASHWLRIPTWEPRQDGRGGLSPSELARLDLG